MNLAVVGIYGTPSGVRGVRPAAAGHPGSSSLASPAARGVDPQSAARVLHLVQPLPPARPGRLSELPGVGVPTSPPHRPPGNGHPPKHGGHPSPPGGHHPQQPPNPRDQTQVLGSGTLERSTLVVVDDDLAQAFASEDPPGVEKILIAWFGTGMPHAELRDVAQVLRPNPQSPRQLWGIELTTPSTGPTNEIIPTPGGPIPQSLWCFLFPGASFCH